MTNKKMYLIDDLYGENIKQAPTRDGYGNGLVALGEADRNVVVLCADLTDSTRSKYFADKFPDRFIEI
ncbi:MAG: transketolase family protein, partial [Chloroflexi bacterium]|nr:transketolase family protein [Chloroflexota bacterium]